MPGKLSGSVVVITGASSGMGKAAALEFAKRGAKVVVAARREDALEATADECRAGGTEALAVPADMTDENDVKELARRAMERFGRIDVWVNNAAVAAAGRFEEVPAEPFRRVMETNFFGYVHGARAVLPIFKKQGKGVLINNASMVARFPEPYFSSYVASKHAVLGFSGSLRQELFLEGMRNVHVSTLMPAAIDTPFFQHLANFSGRAVKVPPPVYPAAKVAKAMADCAENPRREFFVGNAGRLFNFQKRLSTILAEPIIAKIVDRTHFHPDRKAEATEGSLFVPMREGISISGGWTAPGGYQAFDGPDGNRQRSGKGRVPFLAAAAALAVGFAVLFRRPRSLAV